MSPPTHTAGPPDILARIGAERTAALAEERRTDPDEAAYARALATPAPQGRFVAALSTPGLSVIAEVKRASPSRGRIAGIPDPVALADAYAAGGAAAISVLTEPLHFLGSPADLQAVARGVVPVLRKDFVVDVRQIWEARAWGASACLLIVAMHPTEAALAPLIAACEALGLAALVEVHDAGECDVALAAGATIVGVNHRNLRDFSIDMGLFGALRPRIPAGVLAVAESGIHDAATAARMVEAGADAILVGEHLARDVDPAAALRALRGMGPEAR